MTEGAALHGRVAHVMRHFGAPTQTFVPDAILELDRLGWQGWVIASRVANRQWFPYPPDDRLITPGPDERVALAGPPARGGRVLNRLPGRSSRHRRAYRSLLRRHAEWYAPAIERVEPRIVQAHFGWAGISAYPSACRLGAPLVVSFHGTDVTGYPSESPDHKAAYDRMFEHVAAATAVSRFVESELRRVGYRGPVEILPAGVRLDELHYREPAPPDGEVRLLFIGRLVPRKGLDTLLRSLPSVRRCHRHLRLEVVGDGPMREEWKALAGSLGLEGAVSFLGAGSQSQVRARLRGAHVLVMPSREPEGSPMVTKEALAVGLQVVATDCGGTVETLPPEQRHEIVAANDPEALAERIVAVLDAQDRWSERGAAGRAWVEREFDARRLAERMASVYARVLGDGGATTATTGSNCAREAASR